MTTDVGATVRAAPESAGRSRPRGWVLVAFVAVWFVAGAAYLTSGLLVLLLLALTPNPGADSTVLVLKAIMVIVWVAMAAWYIVQLVDLRWRFVVAPVAAWIWTYGVGLVLAQSAYLNWGY